MMAILDKLKCQDVSTAITHHGTVGRFKAIDCNIDKAGAVDITGIMMFTTETQLPTVNTLLHDGEDICYFCYQFPIPHNKYSCLHRDGLVDWY